MEGGGGAGLREEGPDGGWRWSRSEGGVA